MTNNGRDVTVSYSYGNCASTSVRTTAVETSNQVVLTVVLVEEYADKGICPDVELHGKAVALLSRPLGSRTLIDGTARRRS